MTLDMFGRRVAPVPAVVDLRCCDIADVLAQVEPGSVDLVVADPPWDLYEQRPGVAAPDGRYAVLTEDQIGQHMAAAALRLRPGGRMALWTCWPILVEALVGWRNRPGRESGVPWLDVPGITWKSGGAWSKAGGGPGVGYHWRGKSEPVLVGVKSGAAAGRCLSMLANAHTSKPEQHSRKPAPWMADWVRAWVPPGGLVLDLYAGLGSVAEAVVMAGEGRRYIGAEIDPKRHAAACAMVGRAG